MLGEGFPCEFISESFEDIEFWVVSVVGLGLGSVSEHLVTPSWSEASFSKDEVSNSHSLGFFSLKVPELHFISSRKRLVSLVPPRTISSLNSASESQAKRFCLILVLEQSVVVILLIFEG